MTQATTGLCRTHDPQTPARRTPHHYPSLLRTSIRHGPMSSMDTASIPGACQSIPGFVRLAQIVRIHGLLLPIGSFLARFSLVPLHKHILAELSSERAHELFAKFVTTHILALQPAYVIYPNVDILLTPPQS